MTWLRRTSPARARGWMLALCVLTTAACQGNLDEREAASCADCAAQEAAPAAPRPPGAGDPASPDGVGWSTRFPKLSNAQWENSIRDLFHLDAPLGLSESFTQEPRDQGYTALSAAALTVGGDAWHRYQTAAEQVAATIATTPTRLAAITPKGSFKTASAKGSAFITQLGTRVYRRPLSADEQRAYEALFAQGSALTGTGDAFAAGAQVVLEGMLQSPYFLYRVEASQRAGSDRKILLSGYEVASRLSYALWNTTPSDALLTAAAAGELNQKDGVARWAARMLTDARADEALIAFHEETFQTGTYGSQDKAADVGFDAASLGPVLREEARRTIKEVALDGGGGIAGLLTEPVAFVNEDTAPLYGLSGVTGKSLVRRALDPAQRAGLLTQIGFLATNATRASTDPIHRGLRVVRPLLCDEPDPPPAMFQLPDAVSGQTTREVYERATACGGSCHAELINPPGFSFEHFDTVGRLRTSESGKPIDASGTLMVRTGFTADEVRTGPKTPLAFDDAVGLMHALAEEPRVHVCYARHLMQFLLARELDVTERGASESLGDLSASEHAVSALVRALVQLDAFRFRVADS